MSEELLISPNSNWLHSRRSEPENTSKAPVWAKARKESEWKILSNRDSLLTSKLLFELSRLCATQHLGSLLPQTYAEMRTLGNMRLSAA